jgi:hypothetical protein
MKIKKLQIEAEHGRVGDEAHEDFIYSMYKLTHRPKAHKLTERQDKYLDDLFERY